MTSILLRYCSSVEVGLKLNADKCIFKATSIPFFGHVISDQEIKPDPKKIEAIKTMMTPMSKLELQSSVGLCNYLAIYVPDLSSVLQPLCELTKKSTEFQWDSQYDHLYQRAKNHILENWQTLYYYDPNLPVSLETDALLKPVPYECGIQSWETFTSI